MDEERFKNSGTKLKLWNKEILNDAGKVSQALAKKLEK